MNPNAIIIFVRHPELGKVKTRLAVSIGDENALTIYKALLNYTKEQVKQLGSDVHVFYSEEIQSDDIWNGFYKHAQVSGDLGERIADAFQRTLSEGYDRVIIIGSDCPFLNSDRINNAFVQLDSNEYVLGPAEDGGYTYLGMRKYTPELFIDKSWSQGALLDETIDAIGERSYFLDEVLSDIDDINDLKKVKWLADLVDQA